MARADGRFDLYYAEGYAVLVVHPPQPGGKPVYSDDVLNRMRILNVPRVPLQSIQEIIDTGSGEPHRLIEWPAGEELSSNCLMEIDPEGRVARATMHKPKKGGGLPTVDEIVSMLTSAGVSHGIDHDAIEKMIDAQRYDEPIRVAVATEPVHGLPPTVEYTVETQTGKPFLVDDSGRVNLRELNFIQQKHAGDLLARIVPAVEAADGTTIFGDPIPARPAAAAEPIRPGNNTEYVADESEIRATIDGNVVLERGAIHIEPIVSVESVDYRTGNISFEGTVQVRRGVADGFTVHAGGLLEIGESVGRVTISADRELVLKGGINGADEGRVDCGGNIYAKFIESAHVSCRGTLFVVDAVMHASLTVHGNLGLRGKHAGVIGGSALVGGNLWCKKIGSVSETPTRVSIGIDPERLIEYAELTRRVEELRDRIDDLDRILKHLEGRLAADGETSQPETLSAVRAERENNTAELRETEAHLRDLRGNLIPSNRARLIVEEQLYPRVTVNFGRSEYRTPRNGASRTILKCIEGNIIEGGFNPQDPPEFEALIGGGAEDEGAAKPDADSDDTET